MPVGPSPQNEGCSRPFTTFMVCLTGGYLLAAFGEGLPFSAGTLIGAFLGACVGLALALDQIGAQRPPPSPPD